jgi:hypothetical protein
MRLQRIEKMTDAEILDLMDNISVPFTSQLQSPWAKLYLIKFARSVQRYQAEADAQLVEEHFGSEAEWCARRIREGTK